MTTLLVTPFAPYRDGIAAYAAQELRRLREGGEAVTVLSPQPSAARLHLPLGGPRGIARLGRVVADYDRTVIQFAPEMLFGRCRSAAQRTAVWAGLAAVARRTSLDLRIHEVEYGPLEQNPMERRAAALALGQADRVTVHTEAERDSLDRLTGLGRRIEIVDHGRDFAPTVVRNQAEARAELGLEPGGFVFLAIGFLQHHKGFDVAVDAIDRMPNVGARLYVVGSARVDHPDITGYVAHLRSRCAAVAPATLHERFVSDVEFDLWLQAADAVVLPYREIWSSGVIERARLFDTRVLASDLPELRDQAPADTVFFSGVDDLAIAMEKLCTMSGDPGRIAESVESDRSGRAHRAPAAWEVDRSMPDRDQIQSQITARARSSEIDATGLAEPTNRTVGGAIDPLLSIGHLHRPEPVSARPGVTPVKRMIERLIAWQVEPLAAQIESLQRATIAAVASLEQGDAADGQGGADDGGGESAVEPDGESAVEPDGESERADEGGANHPGS
ncbi:MAG: hypothetical protein AAGA65_14020 [Actinomycetota bacterium]